MAGSVKFLFVLSCALLTLAHIPLSHSLTEETSETPIVCTPSGSFTGSVLQSRRGRRIEAFRGIRYAASPTGELRFKPPRDVDQYGDDTVDATGDGPACPQPSYDFFTTSEDCLRLNVYSPTSNSTRRSSHESLLPVLVYIHPGGFYSVSGQSIVASPQYLLDHDVVLVTINYRLGSLGFISTGDAHAPGNLGYKDQVSVLRWIRRNIRSFGGDPAAVTISGYSAGSFSVVLHMLSPMSKGLFHRAIAMSGSPTAQWEVPRHQLHLAERQASILNCPTSSSEEIMRCLRTKSAAELGDSLPEFFEFANNPVLVWRPVIEPDFGQERFLSEDPELLIRSGRIASDVPLILGMTELEFTGLAFSLLSNSTLRERMSNEWDSIAPISFVYDRQPPRSAEISRRLRQEYLGSQQQPLAYNNDTAFALGRLYGDGLISYGVHKLSRLMSETLHSPLYYYKFNYTGSVSHAYYPGTRQPVGAVHHDDLIYLFQGSIFPVIGLDSPHSLMVDKMTTMWTNFAIRGDPNPTENQSAIAGLQWPRLRPCSRKYLQINQDTLEVHHTTRDRFRVWEELFPLEQIGHSPRAHSST